jgi:hypothetical protein
MSDLLLLVTAYVDLEVHLPFAQRLGIGDHPIPAFEGEDVADLQYVTHLVRRHASAIREVDAVAIVADHRCTSTPVAHPLRRWGRGDPDHDRHPGREPRGDRIPRDAGASYGAAPRRRSQVVTNGDQTPNGAPRRPTPRPQRQAQALRPG